MKVKLYLKDDPKAEPIEREAVDAREILAQKDSAYTLDPDRAAEAPEGAPAVMIDGMSPAGLQAMSATGIAVEDLAAMTWDELSVRVNLADLDERDVNALRTWHLSAHDRHKRVAREKVPEPGAKGKK